jgi:3-methylfumaryl-CoA hydratase
MSEWQDWIGRGEQREDRVGESLLRRWAATLDRPEAQKGMAPQSIHWCLCTPDAPNAQLAIDGHPRNRDNPNSYLPPVPLPRRMWASSKIEFHSPLKAGDQVTRNTRIAAITEKHGGSGRLVFVNVVHDTHGPDGLAVGETQTIVYREAAPAGSPPAPPPLGPDTFDMSQWDVYRTVIPSETLLFRYSALTFNSHRIHFDHPYATGQEGYRGLVVHGPLTATLLLDLAQRQFGDNALKRFDFRGISPAICGEELHLVLRGTGNAIELGAFAADGRQVMGADAAI